MINHSRSKALEPIGLWSAWVRGRRAVLAVVSVLVACGLMLQGVAEQAAKASPRLLHERVLQVDPEEPLRAVAAFDQGSGRVAVAQYKGPALTGDAGPGQGQEAPNQRSPRFRPDRDTSLPGTLSYFPVFDPTVAPFKRLTTLDSLVLASDGRTPLLSVSQPARVGVDIERGAGQDARRDRFVGEVTVDFSKGQVVPLPSVAPEAHVLSLTTTPAVHVQVQRDGADNFYLVAKGDAPQGKVRVNFIMDAPRTYFGSDIPSAPVDVLAARAPPLPGSIRRRGLLFAAELGLSPRSDLRTAIYALVAHFRAFEESAEPPQDTGDVYLDLARGKRGICRHRVYAFVITAQALGMVARFVQNEAHSFAEVMLPNSGFMRIDLGGAAGGLSADAIAGRRMYQPAQPDHLPRPKAYEDAYAEAAQALGSNVTPPDPADLVGRWLPVAAMGTDRSTFEAMNVQGEQTEAASDTRLPLLLVVGDEHYDVIRGQALSLEGAARGPSGEAVSGLTVEISLGTAMRNERLLLGVTQTDAEGLFAGDFPVPVDLAPGDYRLVVLTAGNQHYQPSMVR